MNALRYAATKIQPPRLRSARVARPQLEARLAEALHERRVVLLLAPAGFGKTCALASQFEKEGAAGERDTGKRDIALAWISLDEDDDPVRLFACLVGALEPFDIPWRVAPDALLAQIGEGDAGARRAVAELVNALSAADVPHAAIVLDDLHRVQAPAVHTMLDALIERLPPQWTLVLSSRAEPPLALARLRVSDELAEFTLNDLRFDEGEAHALVAATREMPPERIAELLERTQGWPAGLRLYLSALRARPGAGGVTGVPGHARIDHHLFDYLAGEVLDDMPSELHDFLVRCSVLPALTDARCAEVSGDARAADRLDEIERRGLFVTVLDSQERTLVLHDLFREALDDRLHKRFQHELPSLLQRAAIGESDPLRRVGFLMRAADFAEAERVLAEHAQDLVLQGASGEVRRVIEQFPAAWRDASSMLQRIRAACLAQAWKWDDMVAASEAAVAAARATGNAADLVHAQAYLAAGLHNSGKQRECIALLDELRSLPMDPAARAMFYASECSMIFRRGEHAQLPATFGELLDVLERGVGLFSWWACAPSSSWISVRGMRSQIERYCRGALQRIGDRDLAMRAEVRMLQAWTMLWAGRFDEAMAEAKTAASDLRWLAGSANMEANVIVFHAVHDAMCGRTAAVNQMLETWLARAADFDPDTARFWCHDLASFAIRVHDVLGSPPEEFERWAKHLAVSIPADHEFEGSVSKTSAYLARHAAARRDWNEAANLYRRAVPMTDRLESLGQANEIHLRAAHALLQIGELNEAAPILARALERIVRESEQGHAMMASAPVLIELAQVGWGARVPAPLRVELESLAQRAAAMRGITYSATTAMAPAIGDTGAHANAPSGAALTAADSTLSAREREVLACIASGDSNKIIARVLDISPHTVKRHVGNILDKLGLASRGQAAAWLREHA